MGAYTVMNDTEFTIGMLVAFQMFASRLSQPMLRLVGLWQQFQQANLSVQRMGDIMNAPKEPYSVLPSREGEVGVWVNNTTGEFWIGNYYFNVTGLYNLTNPYDANLFGSVGGLVPAGSGNDTIYGGTGNSTYILSNGNNWLDAGGGSDLIIAGVGNNTIYGGAGNDSIYGGGGSNFINLGSGNDYVLLNGGNSTVIGGFAERGT